MWLDYSWLNWWMKVSYLMLNWSGCLDHLLKDLCKDTGFATKSRFHLHNDGFTASIQTHSCRRSAMRVGNRQIDWTTWLLGLLRESLGAALGWSLGFEHSQIMNHLVGLSQGSLAHLNLGNRRFGCRVRNSGVSCLDDWSNQLQGWMLATTKLWQKLATVNLLWLNGADPSGVNQDNQPCEWLIWMTDQRINEWMVSSGFKWFQLLDYLHSTPVDRPSDTEASHLVTTTMKWSKWVFKWL